MLNQEIAEIFEAMADILEIQEVAWKPRAYRAGARSLKDLQTDVADIYRKGGIDALQEISGIGKHLAQKIVDYIKKGRIPEYDQLKRSIPKGLDALIEVPGLGPKKAFALYKKLNIKSVADLKKAFAQHKIRNISGFGEKSEEKIAENVLERKAHLERHPYREVYPVAKKLVDALKKTKLVQKIEVGGSLRRKEVTIGDIDILAVSKNPEKVMDLFTTLSMVRKVVSKGPTKSQVVLKNGMQADIRVIEKKSFGAALQYFTGNKAHNIELRKIAIRKGWKLNEYGLFEGDKMIAGPTEEGVYKKLGLRWIPPEKRKNEGELEDYSF